MIKIELNDNEARALCLLIEGFRNISINSHFDLDDISVYFWMEEVVKKLKEKIKNDRS